MSNSFEVTSYVSKYVLAPFANNIQFARIGSRKFEGMFTDEKYASGDTVNVRLINNFIGGEGPTITPEGVQDRTTPLTIEIQPHQGLEFNSRELTLDIKSAKDQDILSMYVKPAAIQLANTVDQYCISKLMFANNFVGTAGTLINSIDTVNNAAANLRLRGVLHDNNNRMVHMGVGIQTGTSIKNSMKANFTPNINEGVVKSGFIADIYGTQFFETANLGWHTSGVGDETAAVGGFIACGTVKTAVSSGNTIVLEGLANNTTGVVLQGDLIQLEVTQSVNLVTREPTGIPMQFVVLEDADSNGSGECTITVSPSIISSTSSPYQNVSGVIGVGEEVSLVASHRLNFCLVPDGLQIAMPKMKALGAGTDTSNVAFSEQYGIALRYTEGSLVINDKDIKRLDCLVGATCISPYVVRVVG
jgi:hypothetical protein